MQLGMEIQAVMQLGRVQLQTVMQLERLQLKKVLPCQRLLLLVVAGIDSIVPKTDPGASRTNGVVVENLFQRFHFLQVERDGITREPRVRFVALQ